MVIDTIAGVKAGRPRVRREVHGDQRDRNDIEQYEDIENGNQLGSQCQAGQGFRHPHGEPAKRPDNRDTENIKEQVRERNRNRRRVTRGQ